MSDVAVSTNVLSLCSGGGGLDLGLRLAVPASRTVCYLENEVTACGVLAQNMANGGLDDAPIWTDLRTFDGGRWRGTVDWVIGGYPCQPFSNAGRRLGDKDPRHLWPRVERIVSEVQPEWCFFENVGAHLRLGFYEVARSLQGMGYRVAAVLLTAEEVGAPHGRERLFILAHRPSFLQREPDDAQRTESRRDARGDVGGSGSAVADCSCDGRHQGRPESAGIERRSDAAECCCSGHAQLADAERSSGSAEPRQQHQERAEVAVSAGATGHSVADASGVSGAVPQAGQSDCACGGTTACSSGECDCSDVGVAHVPRLEGRRIAIGGGTDELPAWAPGPEDDAGWRRILALRPDLAPALSISEEWELGIRYPLNSKAPQSEVRDLADGLATGLARSDQLHILGNGVVPQQAAYALTMLMDALGD